MNSRFSNRQIARSCALARSTVAEYVRRAQQAGLSWPLPEGWDDRTIQQQLFPPTGKSPPRPRPLPNFTTVHEERCRHKHVTLMLLWDEYKQAYAEGYQYSQFCDLYHRWRGKLDLVLRQEHRAGEKLFVDYAGDTVPITDARRVRPKTPRSSWRCWGRVTTPMRKPPCGRTCLRGWWPTPGLWSF